MLRRIWARMMSWLKFQVSRSYLQLGNSSTVGCAGSAVRPSARLRSAARGSRQPDPSRTNATVP
jgi:hypothetical protein